MGLDPQRFVPAELADGPPWRLLRVATLNGVKDYPLLLRAFKDVVDFFPDTHLDVVGEDVLGGSMQALARELSLSDHVTFHGYQPTDRLPAFYARAHLHVVSSRHEASSVTTLEASLAGVPTVGTAVGHLADWSRLAPPAALTVEPGDPLALAAAIILLLRDPPRRRQLAVAARTWALTHDADSTADAFERLYARVAAAAR